jgi:hypothetical protein
VTQGKILVDYRTGEPISVTTDVNGVRRLAVDANITASIGTINVDLDFNEDSVQIGDPNTGFTLKINADGSIDANVEIDASDGDNIGLKVQERNTSPSDSKYAKRVTAITGTSAENSDTTSLDVSIHDHQGNEFTDRNPIPVSSNYEKIIQVILNSTWLQTAVYDEVITTVLPDRSNINISFREDGFEIGLAVVNYMSDLSWDFKLYRYLLDDSGTKLLDDDDTTPLLLE